MGLVKNLIIGIAIALVASLFIFAGKNFAVASPSAQEGNDLTGNTVVTTSNDGEYQEATLKMEGYNYVLEPATLEKGVPVRMTVDLDTVYGCMRDIVISAFDVI